MVPAQRDPRDAAPRARAVAAVPAPARAPSAARRSALAISPPAAVLAIAAAPPAATASPDAEPATDPPSPNGASPWFDWRRARGSNGPSDTAADPSAGTPPAPPSDADADDEAAAGLRAFPWFGSAGG